MAEEKHFQSINANCDAKTAYNFVLGSTTKVGHLIGLSFSNAGKDLVADTPVPDPESPDGKINVSGTVDFVAWEGGPTDATEMSFRLSPANKATLQEALSSLTGGSEVEAEFVVYDYDYKEKKYFKHFHTDGKKIKYVLTKGTKVNINDRPSTDVLQPMNFQVHMTLTPKSEGDEQELNIAYTASSPFTRRVGVSNVG
jgi:hypothetical protein